MNERTNESEPPDAQTRQSIHVSGNIQLHLPTGRYKTRHVTYTDDIMSLSEVDSWKNPKRPKKRQEISRWKIQLTGNESETELAPEETPKGKRKSNCERDEYKPK